jgi:hypothetical protein
MVRYYPEISSDEFYKEVYSKLEFVENKSESFIDNDSGQIKSLEELDEITKKLCSNKNAGVMNHQTLLKNYLSPYTPYNSLLIFHATGTGKTCSAISIAETYKEYLNNTGTKIRIICSSDIEQEFRKSIINPDLNTFQCTGDTYLDSILQFQKSKNPNILSKSINEFYEFYTYSSFAKEVQLFFKGHSEEDAKSIIKSIYSDSLIIIDEAQNLRENEKKKDITQMLELVTQNANNMKLVLLSATPMFDKPSEIIWLINLLLRVDRKPLLHPNVLDKNGFLTEKGERELKIAIKGRVSYLRGENPFIFPFRLNDKNFTPFNLLPQKNIEGIDILPHDKLSSLYLTTSNLLPEHYNKIISLPLKEDFYSKQLQLHNLCWSFDPNKTISQCTGINGLKIFFEPVFKKKTSFKQNPNNKSLLSNSPVQFSLKTKYNPFNEIEKYSPKFKTILDNIQNSNGIVFIYSKYVYSGILPLAMLLEHYGYSKFSKHGGVNKILTSSTSIENKGSYAIITANKKISGSVSSLINSINSPDNKYGNKIKIILASPIGGVGINLKRVRQIHLLEPSFNMSDMEQTVGRAIRTCSHIDLPPIHRNCTLFFHAVNFPNNQESVDIHLYRNSELKQKPIDKLKSFIQTHSFDCALLQNSNFFNPKNFTHPLRIQDSNNNWRAFTVGDTDDSYFCALRKNGECNPGCKYNFDRNIYEPSQFDTYLPDIHSKSKIFIYMKIIQHLFSISYAYKIHQILHQLKITNYNNFVQISALFAIDKLVSHKTSFSNMFDETGHIIYDSYNDIYVFSPNNLNYNGIPPTEPHTFYSKFVPITHLSLNDRVDNKKFNTKDFLNNHTLLSNNILSHEIFNDPFWSSHKDWLKYEISQIHIDSMLNTNRLQLLTSFIQNDNNLFFFDKYIEKAIRTYIKDILNSPHFLSTHTSTQISFINPDTAESTDIPKYSNYAQFSKELQQLQLFGFYEIIREEGVFMLSYKEDKKNPKGLRPDNIKKDNIVNILNSLYGFVKYVSDKNNKNKLIINESQFNSDFKTITIKILNFDLQLLLRYYQHTKKDSKNWFFPILKTYKNDILKLLNKK